MEKAQQKRKKNTGVIKNVMELKERYYLEIYHVRNTFLSIKRSLLFLI